MLWHLSPLLTVRDSLPSYNSPTQPPFKFASELYVSLRSHTALLIMFVSHCAIKKNKYVSYCNCLYEISVNINMMI